MSMSPHSPGSSAVASGPTGLPVTTAEAAVTALYQAHALGLIRLAKRLPLDPARRPRAAPHLVG
jgi:hypothetical protein